MVRIDPVLADNPSLTVGLVEGKNPQPIILDTRLCTLLDTNLVQRTDLCTWIVNGNRNRVNLVDAYKQNDVTLIYL
jgi:riboflavin biosynthesis pyrimidine reductase